MKKLTAAVLVFAFLFGFCPAVCAADTPGATYYIDAENGSNENTGTSESEPWQTLDRISANDGEIKPGDTILLKCGQTFTTPVGLPVSGEEGRPVTLSSYGEGEKPLICNSGEFAVLLFIHDKSHWDINNLRFSAPKGCGIFICADENADTSFISIHDCEFFDIILEELQEISPFNAAININSTYEGGRVHDIAIENITVHDCAYGVHSNGDDAEGYGVVQTPDKDYNYNIHIKNSRFENCQAAAVVFGACYMSTAENCFIKDCATNPNFACAPIWFRHCDSCVVDHCEVSGSTNKQDGMTVDFDGWTTNCTYQYVYSHDNNRFMKNCLYDRFTRNSGNTVRHCLSVNDNTSRSIANTPPFVPKNFFGLALVMNDFTFENNTLVNTSPVHFDMLRNMKVRNNIIIGQKLSKTLTFFTNLTSLLSTGVIENNIFYDYSVPLNAVNSTTNNPLLDGNYVSALSPELGALDGTNYVGCRLP